MNLSAPRTRRTPAIALRPRGLGVGLGLLLAVALVTTTQHGLATTDAPARAPVADVPTRAEAATVGLAPVGPDRVSSPLHGGAALAAPIRDPATLPRSEPARVRIPAIGVDSELVGLGLQDDGRMQVPPGAFPAGWYIGAPTPGELGPAVLAGHVDYGGSAGVFARLSDLNPGDAIDVVRQDGSTAVFHVTSVEQHPKDAFPTAAVYGDIDHAGLRLITCGGPFDRRARSYEDNVVVFAEFVPDALPDDSGA